MVKQILILVGLLILVVPSSFSQEKSKKELRAERKIAKQQYTESLIKSNDFVFIGRTALPLGLPPVDLGSNINSMEISSEMILSDMPYYGTGYSGFSLKRDSGMRFSGVPEKYTVDEEKNGFLIRFEVNDETDTFDISLSIQNGGSSVLTISSNMRGTIAYQGMISENN